MRDEERRNYRLCVVVAGLLHDIGHCVLGHSYPQYVKMCKKEPPTEHETMGIQILAKSLLAREDIKNAFDERGLDKILWEKDDIKVTYIDCIYMMIAGKKELLPEYMQGKWDLVPPDKKWLLQIVSNE